MVEMWEEEGQQDSEWRDGLDDEIGSGSVLESIRNCPMYSPPRSLTDWCADQVQSPPQRSVTDWCADLVQFPPQGSLTDWCAGHVQSPPLGLFGLQFEYEAYVPPATTTVYNIEASLLYSNPEFLEFDLGVASLSYLPDSICNLTCLRTLDLSEVSFSSLPDSFGKLTSLRLLTLSTHDYLPIEVNVKSGSIDKPINAQALIHSALYSQPCKLNFVGAQATGIYLTVQCFIEKESNAQGFFLEGRYVEAYHRSDIKYFYQSIKKFMRWLDSSEEKMFGGLGVKYIEQKVESAEKSCITLSHLKGKSITERPKRKYRTAYLITLDDLRQLFGHKRADAAKTLGGCWIGGAEMNHIVQFLKVEESNAQGYSLEGRCVKANNLMDETLNSGVQYNQTFQRRPGVEIIQLDSSEERIFGELCAKNIGQNVESAEKSCIAISQSKKKNTIETPKRKYRTKRLITLDDLRQLFGRKRVDAAKTLGVSVPTFKRYCRQNGITFWNGDGCSLIEPMLVNNSVQQNSSGSKPLEVRGEKEISTLSGARQDAVTVKALYGEDIARFQLSSESGVLDLKEAVAKRLELEVGSFNVKYQDEDQEWVLISCDEDLQDCVKFSSSLGNQVIRLLVTDKISNAEKSLKSCRGLKRKRS